MMEKNHNKRVIVPNDVYKFRVALKFTDCRIVVPVDEGAFESEEEAIKTFFTKERIEWLKKWFIEQIKFSKDPFHLDVNDLDGGYNYTEDELFRPDREFDLNKQIRVD